MYVLASIYDYYVLYTYVKIYETTNCFKLLITNFTLFVCFKESSRVNICEHGCKDARIVTVNMLIQTFSDHFVSFEKEI